MKDDVRPDYAAVTTRQQATWATGDFHVIARQAVPVSEVLVQAIDVRPGERVLDIACGSGNAALAAARRNADVVGVDFVPSLIERAKQRIAAAADSLRLAKTLEEGERTRFNMGSTTVRFVSLSERDGVERA